MARRPHRHGTESDRSQAIAFLRDLNFQWVFYSNVIADAVRPLAVYPANPDERGMGENWHAWAVNNTVKLIHTRTSERTSTIRGI